MIETKIKLNQSQMKRDFDYLHANAETAFNEVKTTEYLAGELDNMGIT